MCVCAGLDLLNAPAIQVGVEGKDFSLVCSYPDALIMWFQDDSPGASNTFHPLRVADEGVYMCEVIVFNSQGPPTTRLVHVQLLVDGEREHTHTHTHTSWLPHHCVLN